MKAWPMLGFGVGLRARHYQTFLQDRPAIDWLEVHTENYLGPGGFDLHVLEHLRQDYPFSLHGVGLGIGSAEGYSAAHLARIVALARRIEPALVSEHLCWSAVAERHWNDLLPLSLTDEALRLVCERVQQVQESLGRPILLENVSTYLRYHQDHWSETAFLAEVVKRTGCGVLLDVNNLYVNQCNHGEDAREAMAALPPDCVGEIHLAGHLVTDGMVIDDHGSAVIDDVWQLYREAIRRFGPVSTLIEWDTRIPELPELLAQAELARQHAAQVQGQVVAEPPTRGVAEAPSPPETLAHGQQAFGENLVAPHVAQDFLTRFRGEPGSRLHGFGLYRGNLQAHQVSALSGAYPVLQALVGEAFFEGLAREYGRQYPSRTGDLNAFGAHFAPFLAAFPQVQAYPYFPDIARLEWALHRAWYAADVRAMTAEALAALSPERLEAQRFRLHPACQLLTSDWAVEGLWRAHQQEPVGAFPDPLQTSCFMAVVRVGWQVQVLSLSEAAFVVLQQLDAGEPLGPALDVGLEVDEAFPFNDALPQWLQHEVLVALD